MESSVWLYRYGQIPDCLEATVTACLEASHIPISPTSPDPTGPFGILLFETLDDDLFACARELSLRGEKRVVALTSAPVLIQEQAIWHLLSTGIADVLLWREPERCGICLVERLQRWIEIERLLQGNLVQKSLIGISRAWKNVLRQVIEIARFTDASTLVLGESGTGKELIARLIHTLDTRKDKRELVILDCSTLVPELVGSEFFGHERGAFTGAANSREGAFALAHGGSLFLDEIGELPLHLQPHLLRAVQERTYKRIGGNAWQRTEFRLVCATNRPLCETINQGEFRADLFFRIANWICRLPPLRERRQDILPLARHFIAEIRPETEMDFDEPVRQYLLNRNYPGNVRELRQLVLRMCYRHTGPGPITVGDIPEDDRPALSADAPGCTEAIFEDAIRHALEMGVGLKDISRLASDTAIRMAIEESNGNLQRAASRLGVTDRALQIRRANQRSFLVS